ncbi:hypothetical protein ES703_14168 [subsurface metagenome]
MNIGSSVKVTTLSGKYSKYLSRPGREGKLIKIDGDNGLVHFPDSQRAFSYYRHDHWFKLKDLREVIHREPKSSKRRRN